MSEIDTIKEELERVEHLPEEFFTQYLEENQLDL